MIEWLAKARPPLRNAENTEFLRRWLQTSNDIEHVFNYTLVEPERYLAEMTKRFGELNKIINE